MATHLCVGSVDRRPDFGVHGADRILDCRDELLFGHPPSLGEKEGDVCIW